LTQINWKSEIFSAYSRQEVIDAYETMIKPLRYMIGMITLIAFIIGLVIIYVVTSMVVEENKSSISLLKVLGYRKKELARLILSANTYLVILGYIMSVPLLLASLEKFFEAITAEMNIGIAVKLQHYNIVIGFVIMMGTYELSKLLNSRKINRISMAEALKYNREY
jgi:putative ABC transport system permease protein